MSTDQQSEHCPNCSSKFQAQSDLDGAPLLLHCLHTYCRACVVGPLRHIGASERSDLPALLYKCPQCRFQTKVRGVDALFVNTVVVKHIEASSSRKDASNGGSIELFCENCDDGDQKNLSEYGCFDCLDAYNHAGVALCSPCVESHNKIKAFKMHAVVPIKEFNSTQSSKGHHHPQKTLNNLCALHPNNNTNLFCEDCIMAICSTCQASDHTFHSVIEIKLGALKSKNALSQSIKDCQHIVDILKSNQADLRGSLEGLVSLTEDVHNHVNDDIDAIIASFESLRGKIHENVDQNAMELNAFILGLYSSVDERVASTEKLMNFASIYAINTPGKQLAESSHLIVDALTRMAQREVASPLPVVSTTDITANKFNQERFDIIRKAADELHYAMETRDVGCLGPQTDPANTQESSLVMKNRVMGFGFGSDEGQLSGPGGIAFQGVTNSHVNIDGTHVSSSSAAKPSVVYIADYNNHRVQVFNAITGDYIRVITGHSAGAQTAGGITGGRLLNYPEGLSIWEHPTDPAATLLFVSDCQYHRISVVNAKSGSVVRTFAASMNYPRSMAVHALPDSKSPLLYIADYMNHRVVVLNALTGAKVKDIGKGEKGSGAGQLNSPWGVAIATFTTPIELSTSLPNESPTAKSTKLSKKSLLTTDFLRASISDAGAESGTQTILFVSEQANHRIQLFNAITGKHIGFIGSGFGFKEGQLNHPRGLALHQNVVDSTMLLYVVDNGNHRIQVFNAATGAFVHTIGRGKGSKLGRLSDPDSITVQTGVLETSNNQGADGVVASKRTRPSTVVFVSEYKANRIQVFEL